MKVIEKARERGAKVVHLQCLHPFLLGPGPAEASAVAVAAPRRKTSAEVAREQAEKEAERALPCGRGRE